MGIISATALFLAAGSSVQSLSLQSTLFDSEKHALTAISQIGSEWSTQTAPAKDRQVYFRQRPLSPPQHRVSAKSREFTFVDGRRVLIDWNQLGELDQVQLMDAGCWAGRRELMLRSLLHASGGSPERLQHLLGWSDAVFFKTATVMSVDADGSHFQFARFGKDKPCFVHVRKRPESALIHAPPVPGIPMKTPVAVTKIWRSKGIAADMLRPAAGVEDEAFARQLLAAEDPQPYGTEPGGHREMEARTGRHYDGTSTSIYWPRKRADPASSSVCRIRIPPQADAGTAFKALQWCGEEFGIVVPPQPPLPMIVVSPVAKQDQ